MEIKKIKVAFFADMLLPDFDGAVRTMYQIIRRIPKNNFTFHFFSGILSDQLSPHSSTLVPSVKVPKNDDYRIGLPALSFWKLRNQLDVFKPDIIHIATPSFLGRFALNYGNKNKIPVVAIYHTHFISYIKYYFRKIPILISPIEKLVIRLTRNFYNRCTTVLVPSESLARELRGYGLDDSRFYIWRRGLDLSIFDPSKKRDIQVLLKMEVQNPIILFASRLVWEKNLETLVEIYQECIHRHLALQFVVAGEGVAREELQSLMSEAIFTGNLNHQDLAELYASSDVFLFTSDTETFGNVVVEAMASGVPCIVADAGGPSDLVKHNVTGLKCKPHDPIEFVQAIQELQTNDNLRNSVISNGLEFARTLDWNFLVSTYFDHITEINNKKVEATIHHS